MIARLKALLLKNEVTFLFASTIIVNAGNYAINLLLGRFLGPEQFAEAGAMATLVLILSFLAVGLQLAAAKFSATYFGKEAIEQLSIFKNWIYRNANKFSIVIVVLLLILLIPISNFLHFHSYLPLALIFIGIPAYFNMSVSRGLLQGTNKFAGLAITYQAEMWMRLIATFLLLFIVLKFSLPYASESIGLGFLMSFIASYWIAQKTIKNGEDGSVVLGGKNFVEKSEFKQFIIIIGAYEFSQIMINNSDVLLVKHYFENEAAGLYAAIALIGRVVFFATWTIVTLLFPKVIQMEQQGLNHRPLFWKSLMFVFSIGAGITLTCFFFDKWIMQILFGEAFIEAAPYLWQYAVATTLFACANVFAYYFMSLEKYVPVYISLIAGFFQIMGIMAFHSNLEQVIWVQILLMSALFIAMTVYYFVPKTHN